MIWHGIYLILFPVPFNQTSINIITKTELSMEHQISRTNNEIKGINVRLRRALEDLSSCWLHQK